MQIDGYGHPVFTLDNGVRVYVCSLCGSLAALTGFHTEWHRSIEQPRRRPRKPIGPVWARLTGRPYTFPNR